MSYTLVVVDVQKNFLKFCSLSIKRNISMAVKKAVENKAGIVFLEFKECGRTIKPLLNRVSNYERAFIEEKSFMDGSIKVKQVIRKNKLPSSKIKVVGVYTDYCVLRTVCGLSKKFPKSKIEVIENSCHCSYDKSKSINSMRALRNVSIK